MAGARHGWDLLPTRVHAGHVAFGCVRCAEGNAFWDVGEVAGPRAFERPCADHERMMTIKKKGWTKGYLIWGTSLLHRGKSYIIEFDFYRADKLPGVQTDDVKTPVA